MCTQENKIGIMKYNGTVTSSIDSMTHGIEDDIRELQKILIKNNGLDIRYIKEPSYDLSLLAVSQCGLALQYIKHQTEELCMKAVLQDGMALRFVMKHLQTIPVCIAAINQNPDAFEFVHNQDPTMCEKAVRASAKNYRLVAPEYNSGELSRLACAMDGLMLKYVPASLRTEELCGMAIRSNYKAIKYVEFKTTALLKAAIIQDPQALVYCDSNSFVLTMYSILHHGFFKTVKAINSREIV